ncbi:MAG: endoribonuclease MazF [bacterium]|nr:endoribonuclease MazF [bacterium]
MVSKKPRGYIPRKGDIVWLTFNPQAGHEQKGRRPALVISPQNYNQKSSLVLVCPISSKIKGYPFEVAVEKLKISGVVLADQIKSVDWKARKAKKITTIQKTSLDEVLRLIILLINKNST